VAAEITEITGSDELALISEAVHRIDHRTAQIDHRTAELDRDVRALLAALNTGGRKGLMDAARRITGRGCDDCGD
jgi:hypothetical protein